MFKGIFFFFEIILVHFLKLFKLQCAYGEYTEDIFSELLTQV